MRVLVRYQQQFGNYTTKAIDLDKEDDIRILKQRISEKFKIPINKQLLKIIRSNFTIRLKEDFNVEFYDIHTNCIIFLEYIQSQNELKQNQQKRISNNFYNKLGLLQLGTISEEEKEEVIQLSMSSTQQGVSQTPDENQDYIMDLEYDDYNQQNDQKEKEIKNQVESLLKLTQHRKLDEIKDMVSKKPYILNYLGNCGWNVLHFAIFQNDIQTVDFFLNQSNIDPNQTTLDNWTPLQLSVHKNNSEITKLLLDNKHIDVNQTTQKGSALHIGCKNNDRDIVQTLLEKGIDPNLVDEEKVTAIKYSKNNIINQIIEQRVNIIRIQQDKDCQEQIKKGRLMKPPQMMGYVYKMD